MKYEEEMEEEEAVVLSLQLLVGFYIKIFFAEFKAMIQFNHAYMIYSCKQNNERL